MHDVLCDFMCMLQGGIIRNLKRFLKVLNLPNVEMEALADKVHKQLRRAHSTTLPHFTQPSLHKLSSGY